MFSVKLESSEVPNSNFRPNWYKMNSITTEIPDIRVRNVDSEIHRIVLNEQTRQKELRGLNQFSMSSTIKVIIREWEKCKQKK